MPCAICHRQARGFLWQEPTGRGEPRIVRRFCSRRCQVIHHQYQRARSHNAVWGEEPPMIDATETEKAAKAAALLPLGDYVAQLGLQRPLADYTRDDILTLVEVVIDAYQDHLVEAAEREAIRDAERLQRLEQRSSSTLTRGVPF